MSINYQVNDKEIQKILSALIQADENLLSTPVITSDEIESQYKITKRELAPLVKAHKIPVIRINKRVLRFNRSDIEQFIASKTVGAVSQS